MADGDKEAAARRFLARNRQCSLAVRLATSGGIRAVKDPLTRRMSKAGQRREKNGINHGKKDRRWSGGRPETLHLELRIDSQTL